MMAGMVDLSLFAVSPTDDRRFTVATTVTPPPTISRARTLSPTQSFRERSCYTEHRENTRALPEYLATKPLPPLPSRRVCPGGPAVRRSDPNSRCILMRMKRSKTDEQVREQARDRNHTIQQRRNFTTTPQLTLTLPPSPSNPQQRAPASALVWMPREQVWLVPEEAYASDYEDTSYFSSSYPPQGHRRPAYTRSEPSPRQDNHFDLEPPVPPIREQFLRLMQPPQNERLSPLFQEAVQGVPLPEQSSATPTESPNPASPDPVSPETARDRSSRLYSEVERHWSSGNSDISDVSAHAGVELHRATVAALRRGLQEREYESPKYIPTITPPRPRTAEPDPQTPPRMLQIHRQSRSTSTLTSPFRPKTAEPDSQRSTLKPEIYQSEASHYQPYRPESSDRPSRHRSHSSDTSFHSALSHVSRDFSEENRQSSWTEVARSIAHRAPCGT